LLNLVIDSSPSQGYNVDCYEEKVAASLDQSPHRVLPMRIQQKTFYQMLYIPPKKQFSLHNIPLSFRL